MNDDKDKNDKKYVSPQIQSILKYNILFLSFASQDRNVHTCLAHTT